MASRFWVGGTGTWDASDTTHWAASSGGAGGQSVPGSGDTVTFDGSSGGGTVTLSSALNASTISSLTAGAFTGTIDTTAVASMTMTTMNLSGSGARKFLLNGTTFTLTNTGGGSTFDLTTTTNLDGTSNLAANFTFTATTTTPRAFSGGGRTYGTLTISSNTSRGTFSIAGANTFGSLVVAAGTTLFLPQAVTTTISNAFTLAGSSSLPIQINSDNTTNIATISVSSGTSTLDWGYLQRITAAGGGTFTATNTLDGGRNTSWSISAPSGGGVVGVIGG
jgi:hypothetical protein